MNKLAESLGKNLDDSNMAFPTNIYNTKEFSNKVINTLKEKNPTIQDNKKRMLDNISDSSNIMNALIMSDEMHNSNGNSNHIKSMRMLKTLKRLEEDNTDMDLKTSFGDPDSFQGNVFKKEGGNSEKSAYRNLLNSNQTQKRMFDSGSSNQTNVNDNNQMGYEFICEYCQKVFSSEKAMDDHKFSHYMLI